MQDTISSYRPHDPGHNYYKPGIYLITLVVRKRSEHAELFGSLNDNAWQPEVMQNEIGEAVLRCWNEIPERHAKRGRKVAVYAAVCMPDHFHGVIEVKEEMDVSLGEIIRGFKSGCTMAWRNLQQPNMAAATSTLSQPFSHSAQPSSLSAQQVPSAQPSPSIQAQPSSSLSAQQAPSAQPSSSIQAQPSSSLSAQQAPSAQPSSSLSAQQSSPSAQPSSPSAQPSSSLSAQQAPSAQPSSSIQAQPSSPSAQQAPSALPSSSIQAQPSTSIQAQPYLVERDSQVLLEREMLKHLSKKQRAAYYAQHPEAQQPLWDDNYDDTICISDPTTGEYSQRHFSAMLNYVADNPRRAIMRRLYPQFMQRCLHVRIKCSTPDGTPVVRDYAVFGNLFLLRWARKIQVFCHRLARRNMLTAEEWRKATITRDASHRFEEHARAHKLGRYDWDWYNTSNPNSTTAIDYTRTTSFRNACETWENQIMSGATVIVTPGISKGEQIMKDKCLEKGYPMIHIQKEPIGRYWKPEKARFDACCNGRLLILAPWNADKQGDVNGVPSTTDYSIFHNLNNLAQEICLFDGEAKILS